MKLIVSCFPVLLKTSANGASNSHTRPLPGSQSEMSVEEVAMGFIRVANEAMCRPIRALTQVIIMVKTVALCI